MEDEVIREVDVVLCKSLLNKLILLQYPVRPADRPYDGKQVLSTRIKPKQKKLEFHLALNTHSRNYDSSKAEQIALNTDGANATYGCDTTYFNSSKMDKMILRSTKAVMSSNCLAVGCFSEGRFHITPIDSTLLMRPSFDYMDKSYDLGHLEDGVKEEEEEAQAITVKFAGPNAEKVKKARERSYGYLQQQSEAEPWTVANYHPANSAFSKKEFQKLFFHDSLLETPHFLPSKENCIEALVPKSLLESRPSSNATDKCPQTASALMDLLRSYMLRAYVCQFDHILKLIPASQSLNAERILQQICVLVQGCWVVKSDLLYPKGMTSPYGGITAEILTRARDYILYMYTKSNCITTNQVMAVIQIPVQEIVALFTQVAKKVYNKGWEFKYAYDNDFMENHPSIVQRQEMLWDVRYKQLVRDLRLSQMSAADLSPKKSFPPLPPSPKERMHFKYRETFSGEDTEESGTESSSSEKMDVDYPRKGHYMKRSACPRRRSVGSPVKNGPRSRHPSSTAFEIPSMLLSAIPSLELRSELLNHVRDVCYEKMCLKLSELKESLYNTPLNCIAERDDCDSLLEETLSEIGAQRLKNKWPQNTQPAVLYAFTKFGTSLDKYRDALLDLFTTTARSRPNFLVKKIEDENGQIISDSICKQIFEEYCLYKAGYYYLKGTITPDL